MDTMEISQDNNVPPASAPERSWVEESLDRYANPLSFSKSTIIPEPEVMEEKMLQSASGGHSIKLVVSIGLLSSDIRNHYNAYSRLWHQTMRIYNLWTQSRES